MLLRCHALLLSARHYMRTKPLNESMYLEPFYSDRTTWMSM